MAPPPIDAASRRTGSHPALGEEQAQRALRRSRAPVSVPPPPPIAGELGPWLEEFYRSGLETRDIAEASLEAALRIEKVIGEEPQPAQGIEGYGLLRVLSGHVEGRKEAERRRADLRLILSAIAATLAILGTAVGVAKALGWLH